MACLHHRGDISLLAELADAKKGPYTSAVWHRLCLHAESIALMRGFERLVCLEGLSFDLYVHQRRAVVRVMRDLGGRAILADEVGLGKTIEAGAICREYLLRGFIQTALILAPASLQAQWLSEMRGRLRLPFQLVRHPASVDADLAIVSLDRAKQGPYAERIRSRHWDLVIVDEAHRLSNRATLNWRFVNSLAHRRLLLLTATPVQNDLSELYNLVNLIQPGRLGTFREFKRRFVEGGRTPKNADQLREILNSMMVRTTRREALLRSPPRRVQTEFIAQGTDERSFYQGLLQMLRSAYRSEPPEKRNLLPLIALLRQAGSHPLAACRALETMLRRGGPPLIAREEAASLIALGRRIRPSKLEAALNRIALQKEPVILFTAFRRTQRLLARALEERGQATLCLHGGQTAAEREATLEAFRRGEGTTLLSTEVGGEGLNLQFCRRVINYDLPWNPMRLEQRIGRVHRIGQTRTVWVLNLVTEGTIEAAIADLLERKLSMFKSVIGEIEELLARLPKGFELSVAEAALGAADERDMTRRFASLERSLDSAKSALESARRLSGDLLEPASPLGPELAAKGG